ncbi:hypothetical protein CLAIMM_10376 [Cladophialophora immunda]|nr:hypothetical protein CLAIMM_10376 [Cladophialophora immunda]
MDAPNEKSASSALGAIACFSPRALQGASTNHGRDQHKRNSITQQRNIALPALGSVAQSGLLAEFVCCCLCLALFSMSKKMSEPGAVLASTVTPVAALGFVPVAIHFNFFPLLNQIGPIATAEELTKASDAERSDEDKQHSPLCLRLTEDTMFAMAGLGLVDLVDDRTFQVNPITAHMVAVPSSLHGMLHFTTEPLWSAAFLMRQLRDTNFEYPFQENKTPTQYGYKMIGEERFVNEHTYSIMHMQGRMPSFSSFMEGKFGRFGSMPDRVKSFGYDLALF